MRGFPIGMIVLIVASILIYFGLAHRVLDRMRLTDRAALVIIGAMIIGSFIDIPIVRGEGLNVAVNVGGSVVPVGMAVYVLSKAGTTKEWLRAIFATLLTAGLIFFIGSVVMSGDPGSRFDVIDPIYVYPIVAGGIAYIAGRSRRASFIAAVLGVVLLDAFYLAQNIISGTNGFVHFGGAGIFDSTVLAGIVAVLLAEVVGETRERLQGGPVTEGRPKELLAALRKPEFNKNEKDKKEHNRKEPIRTELERKEPEVKENEK